MKSSGTFSLMTPHGPWFWVGALEDRAHLGGHLAGARLTIDPETGVTVNLAAVHLGSWVLGWMPGHRRCTPGLDGPRTHRCLWKHAPHVHIETAPTHHRHTPATADDTRPAR